MKNKKGVIALILSALFVVGASACTGRSACNPNKPDLPLESEYLDAVKSLDYPAISEDILYTTYYIDSKGGNDSNDGLSPATAKNSLAAANAIIQNVKENVPTKVLFKAGTEYEGTLAIHSYKTKADAPLVISAYDCTEENKYAKITCGEKQNAITLNDDNVRISNLECTSVDGKGDRGIYVTTSKKGAAENIVISNNYFHDFAFMLPDDVTLPTDMTNLPENITKQICPEGRYSRDCGGIIFEANTSIAVGPSWFENIWLENNVIERVSRTGIWFNSYWIQRAGLNWGKNPYYDDETNYYPHYNINIRGNNISYTGGDGVVLIAARNSFMEYNTCYHAQVLGRGSIANAGLWIHSCVDTVMQYNEAAYTHFRTDGQGFDIDIACSNILFQYNYSHHNEGGGLLCCNTDTALVQYDKNGDFILDEDGCPIEKTVVGDWRNVVIKNNVFADNNWADMIFAGKVDDILFENNTIVKSGKSLSENGDRGLIFEMKDFDIGIAGKNWQIKNNIFYSRKQREDEYRSRWDFVTDGGWTLENNVYYGFSEEFEAEMKGYGETNYVKADPQFVSAVSGTGYNYAKGFVPANEAMYQGASKLAVLLKYDFLGNDVSNVLYYGAFGKYTTSVN